MRRLLRDAALIAATALAIWFMRGGAQGTVPVYFGTPLMIICGEGSIKNAEISDGALDRVTLRLPTFGPESTRGSAVFNDCLLYPDLRTPTP